MPSKKKQLILAAWIDSKKAFDKVWKKGSMEKLRNQRVNERMYKQIKEYLHSRRARMQLDAINSKKNYPMLGVFHMEEYYPQDFFLSSIMI
jgi:cytidylate kinase